MTRSRERALVIVGLLASPMAPGCQGGGAAEPREVRSPILDMVSEEFAGPRLVGLQAFVTPDDYRTEAAFESRLRTLLAAADEAGVLGAESVAVLPEYIGAWLVAVDEDESVYTAATTSEAMTPVILAHLGAWLALRGDAPAEDADTYAVFAVKAERMAFIYQRVLQRLAAEFTTTIVGGSILLPEPEVVDGKIVVHPGGPLSNVSFVFGPNGDLLGPPVVKVFPTEDEQGFIAGGDPEDLPVFETPAGRVAVLVCADAWYPETYEALAGRDVDALVVPVYVSGEKTWDAAWGGYSGHPTPADVDGDLAGEITEGEAWRRFALPARGPSVGASVGMTVPLRGALWNLGTDGQGLWFSAGLQGAVREAFDEVDGPAIFSVGGQRD